MTNCTVRESVTSDNSSAGGLFGNYNTSGWFCHSSTLGIPKNKNYLTD